MNDNERRDFEDFIKAVFGLPPDAIVHMDENTKDFVKKKEERPQFIGMIKYKKIETALTKRQVVEGFEDKKLKYVSPMENENIKIKNMANFVAYCKLKNEGEL